jgi:phytoene synthase
VNGLVPFFNTFEIGIEKWRERRFFGDMFAESLTVELNAVADDRLKDFDNLAWLQAQAPEVIAAWRPRMIWIRQIDRLAEASLFGDREARCSLRERLRPEGRAAQHYVAAILRYHQPALAIRSHRDFYAMARSLGGGVFRMFPYLNPNTRRAILPLGTLDQVFNVLRDVYEDSLKGLNYFPTSLRGSRTPRILRYWFEDQVPELREAARGFAHTPDLHPSLVAMAESCWDRYRRIEACYREVDFEPQAFHEAYWAQVRRRT